MGFGVEKSGWCVVFLLLVVGFFPAVGFGIILHTDVQPTDKPVDTVLGKWGSNASCVAVSGDYVLTTRHQNSYSHGLGTTVKIGGVNYRVVQETNILSDLRVARITTLGGLPATLSDYASLYSLAGEDGATFLIGGFGKIRGGQLQIDGITYGYQWAINPDNVVPVWGRNVVNGLNTQYVQAFFDGAGEGDYITSEAAPAEYDSGCGWFIKQGGWKLAGITVGVERVNQTWFRDINDVNVADPDYMVGLRVGSYKSDIEEAILNTHVISGHVWEFNEPVGGVLIDGGGGQIFAKTNSGGYYELWVPDGWSGVVVPAKEGMVFGPVSISYANVSGDYIDEDYSVEAVLRDDFNDSKRGAGWKVREDDHSRVWIEEIGGRLEVKGVDGVGDFDASYAANEWGIDAGGDFSLKVDFHHEVVDENDSCVFIRLAGDMVGEDYVLFEAANEGYQKYWRYSEVVGGVEVNDSNMSRGVDDGVFYLSYSVSEDELYLSTTGYGKSAAWEVVGGLWSSLSVQVSVGGGAGGVVISSGEMELDNFVVNSGALVGWPPKTDVNGDGFIDLKDIGRISAQWLKGSGDLEQGESLDADIDGDDFVNFLDAAEIANVW